MQPVKKVQYNNLITPTKDDRDNDVDISAVGIGIVGFNVPLDTIYRS